MAKYFTLDLNGGLFRERGPGLWDYFDQFTKKFTGNAVGYFDGPDSERARMTEVSEADARRIFVARGGNPRDFTS